MKKIVIGFALSMLSLLVACSHARVVEVEPGVGGSVAIASRTAGTREEAVSLMEENCGGARSYKIVKEGEAAIGTDSSSSNNTNASATRAGRTVSGSSSSFGSSRTRTKSEWRIDYHCLNAPNAPSTPRT